MEREQYMRICKSPFGPTMAVLDRLLNGMGYSWTDYARAYVEGTPSSSVVAEPKTPYGKQRDDLAYIRLYAAKAAAGGGTIIDHEAVSKELAFQRVWVKRVLRTTEHNLGLVQVRGTSMEPALVDGDMVLFDTSRTKVGRDGIYVFVDESEEGYLLVKRLRETKGQMSILSDNPDPRFHREPVPREHLRIIGRVVWVGRKV